MGWTDTPEAQCAETMQRYFQGGGFPKAWSPLYTLVGDPSVHVRGFSSAHAILSPRCVIARNTAHDRAVFESARVLGVHRRFPFGDPAPGTVAARLRRRRVVALKHRPPVFRRPGSASQLSRDGGRLVTLSGASYIIGHSSDNAFARCGAAAKSSQIPRRRSAASSLSTRTTGGSRCPSAKAFGLAGPDLIDRLAVFSHVIFPSMVARRLQRA